MKKMINFSTSPDDINRYQDEDDLRTFYRGFGLDGLEILPLGEDTGGLIRPDMVIGLHMNCLSDWMNMDHQKLISHYQKDLDEARKLQAEYVVFHVTQVSFKEILTYRMLHTDEEVINKAAQLINDLLDGHDYDFYFLMENLWWPGLNFQNENITQALFEQVHYKKKGFMLDTGHFMNGNTYLRTPDEAIDCLNSMLDRHKSLIPAIRGIHLNQSLSGNYVEQYKKFPLVPERDPKKLFCQAFQEIFKIDQHLPFEASGVSELIHRIDPSYVTLEYITSSRTEHEKSLRKGLSFLR